MNDVLYKKLCDGAIVDGSNLAHDVKRVIDEFFESSVCIPKGENRHPDADIIHAYAEGSEVQYKGINNTWKKANDFPSGLQYRIKPVEPVYEWQWFVGCKYGVDIITSKFLTESEVLDLGSCWNKLEETKRERKQ